MKDLSFLSAKTGVQAVPLKLTGVNSGEATVFQKLLLFLCADNSDGLHAGTASDFPALWTSANLRDELSMRQSLNLALSEAVAAIKTAQQGEDLTDSERLASATVADLSISGDQLSFKIEMSTYASDSVWTVTNSI